MPRKTPDTAKILSRRALVNIFRDAMTLTPRVVWQHEIPILEAVFGEGNVRPVEAAVMDESFNPKPSADLLPFNKVQDAIQRPSETASIGYAFIGDAQSEYNRLVSVYGRHSEVNVSMAEHVYGRFQEGRFESVVGKAEVEDLPEAQLRELARAHGYIPATHRQSSDIEKEEASKRTKALAGMTHEALVKLAEDLHITV